MSHPIDVLKAALQEAKTEAATLRIARDLLVKERNVVIEERNKARARVKELEQQNAVQRENVDEAMRAADAVKDGLSRVEAACARALAGDKDKRSLVATLTLVIERTQALRAVPRTPAGGPEQDRGGAAIPPADTLARIRELEAEVQRLQQDRAQMGAFGFKPLGIR